MLTGKIALPLADNGHPFNTWCNGPRAMLSVVPSTQSIIPVANCKWSYGHTTLSVDPHRVRGQ